MTKLQRKKTYHTALADHRIKKKVGGRKLQRKSKIHENNNVQPNSKHVLTNLISNCKTLGWIFLSIVCMILLCLILSSPITLIPQHDVFRFSEYWYEAFFIVNLSYSLTVSLKTVIDWKMIVKINSSDNFKFFLKSYVMLVMLATIPGLVYQLIWTEMLRFNSPTPLRGIVGYFAYYINQILIWFILSSEERAKDETVKRYKSFIVYKFIISFFITFLKDFITIVFKKIRYEYQWIFAFVLPLQREMNILLLNKILHKMGHLEDTESKVATIINMNVRHAMYISIQLSTSASLTTGYCILGVEFLINMWCVFRIVRLHRKISPKKSIEISKEIEEKKKYELLTLTLIELIEVLVPLAYTVVTAVAYHGPNAKILGNIGSSMWQFQKIERIDHLLFIALEIFVVDFICALFTGMVLWKFCSINFLGEIYQAICKYGYFISLQLSTALLAVS